MATREMVACPPWVRVVEAEVPVGAEYWALTRVEYQDDQHSGGTHHIYTQTPHDASQHMVVSNGQESWPIALDKPTNEPAANHAMFGHNTYSTHMAGLPSDRVEGMHMPGNHHVSYYLSWERRRKEDGGTGSTTGTGGTAPSTALQQALLSEGEARQVLRFNPGAALQVAIFRDGFVPNSAEFDLAHEGIAFVAQRAERLSDGAVRVYFVQAGVWSDVRFVQR